MTGYLMVRCGTCGATNRIRSLGQPPPCEACSLSVSKFEIPTTGMLLAFRGGNIDTGPLGVPGDKVS